MPAKGKGFELLCHLKLFSKGWQKSDLIYDHKKELFLSINQQSLAQKCRCMSAYQRKTEAINMVTIEEHGLINYYPDRRL
jgi:hypothetical protein